MISRKIRQLAFLTIGVVAFSYVLYRAIIIGVTYDEVWTIEGFVPQNFKSIMICAPCDANNHIINTLLIKLFFSFGNHSIFIARLPNVFAFILYVIFSYKIADKHLSSLVGFCLFILLLLNPYVLDFFSLARGYGLSLGFVSASIYYFINYFSEQNIKTLVVSLFFGAMAVISNFSVLNYFLVILIILNLISLMFSEKFDFKKNAILSFIVLIPLILIIYTPLRELRDNGSLYYGGSTGFYADTLLSLAKYTFYSPNVTTEIEYSLNFFIAILLISILISFFFNHQALSSKNVILVITLLCIISVVAQYYLLGTLYLIDRTALFFYPLIILTFCFSLEAFSKKWYSKVISVSAVFLFGYNFLIHANFYKTATWYFDAHSQSILAELNEIGKVENKKLKIDFSWPFKRSFYYYLDKNNFGYIDIIKNKQDREDLNTSADYYIYLNQSLEKVGYDAKNQKINSIDKDTFKRFSQENILIFKNLRK